MDNYFSRGWDVGQNSYSFDESTPSEGIVFVKTGLAKPNDKADRRFLSGALDQLRWEFGDAYLNNEVTMIDWSTDQRNSIKFEIKTIHVVVLGGNSTSSKTNGEMWTYCRGIRIPASLAFDGAKSSISIVESVRMLDARISP